MKIPLSWIKEYVDIDLPLEELASKLTMCGLEVEGITLAGLPMPAGDSHDFKIDGLSWEPDKIVVAEILEVLPHPNADRLVLCRLNDGVQELVVLTGAPNLFPYKGQGTLPRPLKVAYAREGARIYDGHQAGQVVTTLKRTKIRGIDSFSMVCSEKELGISDEHEGIIILDDDAPTGVPLVDYMGDAVLEIGILPNMIHDACVVGVAREISAITGKPLRKPQPALPADGPSVIGEISIQITDASLNPRFVLGLVRGVKPQPSPYWVQRRLRLAGMRPINSIVDATNYVMLELNEPLHAFDYDRLVQRAGGKPPVIITRSARQGEQLKTLDGVDRILESFTILVTDTAGPLSLAGVMGGAETEVTENTQNVLLEGAAWNFINIRRTVSHQRLNSEAAYRFARGLHPELALKGVQLGLDRIARWSGGKIAANLVDNYPQPFTAAEVSITPAEVRRLLGIDLSVQYIAGLLNRLEFTCRIEGEAVIACPPDYRCDIGQDSVGKADIMEEIARLYGYDVIPIARLADELPAQRNLTDLQVEEKARDLLVSFGLQEVITYRLTSAEREARLLPGGQPQADLPYVRLLNPLTPERSVFRRSLLASMLDVVERNIRLREHLGFFEIGPVFLPLPGELLPAEPLRLVIAMTGISHLSHWDRPEKTQLDFFDLKGMVEALLRGLHIETVDFVPCANPIFHPGKCAEVRVGELSLGVMGELHPQVKERWDLGASPLLAADLDVPAILQVVPARFEACEVPGFPPVLEDIAVVVEESLPVGRVLELIRLAGGNLLAEVHLFDIYRGAQIGAGKKSLAFSLTYQALDRTLTDGEAAQVRQRIIRRLEKDLGAKLRT